MPIYEDAQVILTVPILEGLDGIQKMSKSLGNAIGINERPVDIYGKLMSISDALMWRYFELLTRVPEPELETLKSGHPMEAKKRLALTITAQYHGDAAAAEAEANFTDVFQRRLDPKNVEEISVSGASVGARGVMAPLVKILMAAGAVTSNSEARRMIQQGAVEVDDQRVSDVNQTLATGQTYRIRVGKRQFKRVTLTE